MDSLYVKHLTGQEGNKLYIYDDATGALVVPGYRMIGHPTIGVGRALDVHGISEDESFYLRNNDIIALERALGIYPWWTGLSPLRQFIIVDMAFNMGLAGLLKFVNMIAALQRHDYPAAAVQMLHSQWAQQVPARAGWLATTMRTGVLPPDA